MTDVIRLYLQAYLIKDTKLSPLNGKRDHLQGARLLSVVLRHS